MDMRMNFQLAAAEPLEMTLECFLCFVQEDGVPRERVIEYLEAALAAMRVPLELAEPRVYLEPLVEQQRLRINSKPLAALRVPLEVAEQRLRLEPHYQPKPLRSFDLDSPDPSGGPGSVIPFPKP